MREVTGSVRLTPLRIVAIYVVVAAAWILASDAIVEAIQPAAEMRAAVNVAKGWVFVGVTGALLLVLVRRLFETALKERADAVRAAAQAEATAVTLRLVLSVEQALVRAADEGELLAETCRALVADPRFACAWIGLAEPPPERRVRVVAWAGEDHGYLDDLDVRWDDGPLGRGPTGTAVRESRTIVANDVAADPRLAPWRERLLAAGFRASLAIPIRHLDRPLGVLSIYGAETGAFAPGAVVELERVASDIGYGIAALRTREERDRAVAAELAAARDLAAATERYERCVARSPLSIVITDLAGTVLAWNPSAERLWRVGAAEALGTFAPWIVESERPAFLALLREVAAGAEPVGSIRARHRADGTEVMVRVANAAFTGADGQARIVFMSEDVTREVQAERRLERAAARLEGLHALGRAILEARTIEEVGRNAAHHVRELLGPDRVTVSLVDLAAATHTLIAEAPALGDPWLGVARPMEADVGSGFAADLSIRLYPDLRAAGPDLPAARLLLERGFVSSAVVPLEADEQTAGYFGLHYRAARQFTEGDVAAMREVGAELSVAIRQARYREALAEREARIRAILEASPNPVFTVDQDGQIRYANPAAAATFGAPPEGLAGTPLEALVPELGRDDHRDLMARYFADPVAGRMTHAPSLRARRWNGSLFPAEVSLAPVEMPDGPQVVVTVVDLSERAALEAQLRQAQKMEVMGQFVSILAHDLRSYFNAISWSADLLARDLGGADPRLPDVAQIRAAVDGGLGMIRAVLGFARPGAEGPGATDLRAHLAQVGGILARLVGSSVVLETHLPEGLPDVALDPASVTQVLFNLAANARDAMPAGGTFRVAARARTVAAVAGGGLRADELPPGRYVRLIVADTGTGMDAETARRAFEAFYTTKTGDGAPEGTGLGLSSAYLIVTRAGGRIDLRSRPGKGTTFTIDLPAA